MNEVTVIHRCCSNNRSDVFVKNEMLRYSTTKALMTTINEMRKMKLFLMRAKRILIKTIEIDEKSLLDDASVFSKEMKRVDTNYRDSRLILLM